MRLQYRRRTGRRRLSAGRRRRSYDDQSEIEVKSHEYCTLDVFTERRFGGNPLAVVLDADDIDDESMQRIAREFNYSETTFVLRPSDASQTARVRIFTPGSELPFAGHPTVGTAYALAALGRIPNSTRDIVFEEGVGPVPVRIDRDPDGSVRRCVLTTAQAPERIETLAEREAAAAMLGLPAAAIAADPEVWSCGLPFLVVPLADVDALQTARLDLPRWSALLAGRSSLQVYLIARSGEQQWRARMFAPGQGVPEDPATGSAAAALAGWLARRIPGDGDRSWQILQGVEMGRPSTIELLYKQTGDTARRVRVGGSSVLFARGTLV
jgi:trans-2,3-dihydro-3-hydroxyanthranilate isomerase